MDPFTFAIVTGLLAGLGSVVLIELARRSPEIMMWLRRYFLGLDFLVVGHEKAGKTSFYNYIEHRWFADVNKKPDRTRKVSDKKQFDVYMNGELRFRVRSAFDIPGDLPSKKQADLVSEKNPKILIVFIATDYPDALNWLETFLSHLSLKLKEDWGLSNNLECLTLVLNKVDKVEKKDIKSYKSQMQDIVNKTLSEVTVRNVRMVEILPCTLLESKGGDYYANEVVLSVIRSLPLPLPLNQRLMHR